MSFLKEGCAHGARGRVKPFNRSCPVPGDRLTGDRVTALFNVDGGEWLYDKWTDARTWQRAGPWKGYTFLKLKPPTAASTGAASSGAHEVNYKDEEKNGESSSDGSYSIVATEHDS